MIGLHSIASTIGNGLSRTTSSKRFIPEVDGLRAIAILAVILHHINYCVRQYAPPQIVINARATPLYIALEAGNFGVNLFFTISGFILSLPIAEHFLLGGRRPSLKEYFGRRLARLEPPYLICLCAYFLFKVVAKKESTIVLFPHLLASAFYLHNSIYHELSTILLVNWSLEVEVQFYIVLPLLAKIFAVRKVAIRRALLLFMTVLAAVLSTHVSDRNLLRYLHYFLVGFLLTDFYVVNWNREQTRLAKWDLIGIASWFMLLAVLMLHKCIEYFSPICILLAYLSTFRGQFLNWLFTRPALVVVGGMCYTIYLYHFPIIMHLGKHAIRHMVAHTYEVIVITGTAALLPAILTICACLFVLTEKPFMQRDWTTRILSKLHEFRKLV
jgi:peptidoglycan/LPS O-acetylase OafA/YrhL